GVGEIEDYMPVGSGLQVPNELVRRVRVVRGKVTFHIECRPAFDYARASHAVHIMKHGARFDGPGLSLTLASSIPLEHSGQAVTAEVAVGEGQEAVFVLCLGSSDQHPRPCPNPAEAEDRFRETVAYWRRWLSHCTYVGRYREIVQRSALTLKLLSFES